MRERKRLIERERERGKERKRERGIDTEREKLREIELQIISGVSCLSNKMEQRVWRVGQTKTATNEDDNHVGYMKVT